jgi:hypothetical protein
LKLLRLPGAPRIRWTSVRLPRGALFEAGFLLRGTRLIQRAGHGVAIRQLCGGEEVGRVTFELRPPR